MGDGGKASLQLQFNPQSGWSSMVPPSPATPDCWPFRELDDALELTPNASDYLQESGTGRNIRVRQRVPRTGQSVRSGKYKLIDMDTPVVGMQSSYLVGNVCIDLG